MDASLLPSLNAEGIEKRVLEGVNGEEASPPMPTHSRLAEVWSLYFLRRGKGGERNEREGRG